MLDILSLIHGKKRTTLSGWHSFNAVCCQHRGHKADKRGRAGILFDGSCWTYSCFNCNFKCGVSPGKNFSNNVRTLLVWLGLDYQQIDKLSFENYRSGYDSAFQESLKPIIINFDKKYLPEGSELLTIGNDCHKPYIEYLYSRSLSMEKYKYYVTPNAVGVRDRNRIIIPYYFNNELVGYTSRYIDNKIPKYISEQQHGYVFNYDMQNTDASVVILVEGQLDAISIDGCAYLGSTISDEQARLISKLGKEVIVVPDRDKSGMGICDRALELGYRVSIPEWHPGIKDTNNAVQKYGRLPTILSILESATTSKITVTMKRRFFK